MADVTFQREEYTNALYAWDLVNDVVAGSQAVKARKTRYLPIPGDDPSEGADSDRYKNYILRALFYNVCSRTLQGLTGAAFRKVPALEKPATLNYVEDDIDGAGVSIYQQSQIVLREVLKLGRDGLLVDYPQVMGPVSRADMESGRVRATVARYSAKQIINWRTEKVGAIHKLVLVVLEERGEEITVDGFGIDYFDRYRVLRLVEGVYTQETWRFGKDGWILEQEQFTVLDGAGRRWDHIPFIFVGSNNNDPSIDPAPMYDLAEVNISHYQNSAELEEANYVHAQGTLVIDIGKTDATEFEKVNPKGIRVGARGSIVVGEGGSANLLQLSRDGSLESNMGKKEDYMVALGARLIQPGSASKTATEAQSDVENEHSVLSLAVSNVNEAYTRCLDWLSRFMGVSGEVRYEIDQEFTAPKLDAQMLTALIAAWQSGKYPEGDFWAQFRKYGLIDPEKTDDDIRGELETQVVGLEFDE